MMTSLHSILVFVLLLATNSAIISASPSHPRFAIDPRVPDASKRRRRGFSSVTSLPRGGEADAPTVSGGGIAPGAPASSTTAIVAKTGLAFVTLPSLALTLANLAAGAFVGSGCAGAFLASWMIVKFVPVVSKAATESLGRMNFDLAMNGGVLNLSDADKLPLMATLASLLVDSEIRFGRGNKKNKEESNEQGGGSGPSISIRYPVEETAFLAALWTHARSTDPVLAGALGMVRSFMSLGSAVLVAVSTTFSRWAVRAGLGSGTSAAAAGIMGGEGAAALFSGAASLCSSLAVASSVPRHFLGLYLLTSVVVIHLTAGGHDSRFLEWWSTGLFGTAESASSTGGGMEGNASTAATAAAATMGISNVVVDPWSLAMRLWASHALLAVVKGSVTGAMRWCCGVVVASLSASKLSGKGIDEEQMDQEQ